MSDANKAPGEPVDEGYTAEDVVGSANESLADAEAAQRDVGAEPVREEVVTERVAFADDDEDARYAAYAAYAEPDETSDAAPAEPVVVEERETVVVDSAAPAAPAWRDDTRSDEPRSDDTRADEPGVDQRRADVDSVATTAYSPEAQTTAYDADAATTAYAPPAAVTPSEPAVVAAPVPQPIFVQAPEEPRARGNRGAIGLIGILAALSFAVLYLAAYLVLGLIAGDFTIENIVDPIIAAVTSWWLWVATAVFFLGFWLFGAIINRGRWGHWVIWGLLVGLIGYGAHLVGWLFQEPFWNLTQREGIAFLETQLVAPLAFIAFVIARELTIWFGAWAAARGRRLEELNNEARREYERTLEAGPQLAR